MRCPVCANVLSRKTVGGITVDVCAGGCGGIWFDRYELMKVDESHESAGEELWMLASTTVKGFRARNAPTA